MLCYFFELLWRKPMKTKLLITLFLAFGFWLANGLRRNEPASDGYE